MSEAGEKIIAGMKDAVAFAQGDTTRGRVWKASAQATNAMLRRAAPKLRMSRIGRTYGDLRGPLSNWLMRQALNRVQTVERMRPMTMTLNITICQISNGWLVSTPGTQFVESEWAEDRQPAVTFYPDFASVLTGLPDEAQKALKHEQDAETKRRNYAERYKGEPIGGVTGTGDGTLVNDDGIAPEAPPMGQERAGEPVDQTEQMEPVPEEVLSKEEAAKLKEE